MEPAVRSVSASASLTDWGMLDRAKKHWTEILAALAPEISNGTPIVGLEPACVSAFRDEHTALFQAISRLSAVIKTDAEIQTLKRIGIDHELLRSGCCGMAGSFGFERDKYDASVATAERVLLPAIRAAPADSIILANGFSCREQIEQLTGRATTHVAELLAA